MSGMTATIHHVRLEHGVSYALPPPGWNPVPGEPDLYRRADGALVKVDWVDDGDAASPSTLAAEFDQPRLF